MSKKRNRALLDKATNNRDYNLLQKNEVVYCLICSKRAGKFGVTCSPVKWVGSWRAGYKNPKKAIAKWEARGYRSWKHNRKTQWK